MAHGYFIKWINGKNSEWMNRGTCLKEHFGMLLKMCEKENYWFKLSSTPGLYCNLGFIFVALHNGLLGPSCRNSYSSAHWLAQWLSGTLGYKSPFLLQIRLNTMWSRLSLQYPSPWYQFMCWLPFTSLWQPTWPKISEGRKDLFQSTVYQV